ncbi:hypothetical protein [Flavobacterium sp. PS2]|uniref:hypothetical protein n=1 Tax=Flavobacterium sp. PS2 TaxID=3384157 RepID=UPI00390C7E66
MNNKLQRITQALLCCFLLIVFGCETEQLVTDEQTPQTKSIQSAKTWFDKYESNGINYELFQNLEYNWNEAKKVKSEDGTETIIVPIVELKEDREEIWSQKLYLYKLGTGDYKVLLFEIYPDKDVPSDSQTIEGGDFNGYMAAWDLKMGFVRASRFKNNQVIENGIVAVISIDKMATSKAPAISPCVDDMCQEGPGGLGDGKAPPPRPPVQLRPVVVTGPSTGAPVVYTPRTPATGGGGTSPGGFTSPGGGSSGGGVTAPTPVQIIDALTGKAKCIYEKLKSSSSGFENAIKKFDGEFTLYDLKLTINNNLSLNVYGETQPPVNYVTEIQINNNSLNNLSDLGKATVFAHEIIHAEIFRKMLIAAQKGSLDSNNMTVQEQTNYVNSLKNNFPGLYDYYFKRYKPTWNHEMMASHYRSVIADIIQQFDNKRLPRSTYEAVTWVGLGKLDTNLTTIAWDNLSETEKAVINKLINDNFYNGPSNCN